MKKYIFCHLVYMMLYILCLLWMLCRCVCTHTHIYLKAVPDYASCTAWACTQTQPTPIPSDGKFGVQPSTCLCNSKVQLQ